MTPVPVGRFLMSACVVYQIARPITTRARRREGGGMSVCANMDWSFWLFDPEGVTSQSPGGAARPRASLCNAFGVEETAIQHIEDGHHSSHTRPSAASLSNIAVSR